MNRLLTEEAIRQLCRSVLEHNPSTSGRQFLKELHARHGAWGKRARVFAIWREEGERWRRLTEVAPHNEPTAEITQILEAAEARAQAAEAAAARARARAELAEHRESAHQNRWANEIHDLRAQVAELKSALGSRTRGQVSYEEYARLFSRLQETRARLVKYEPPEAPSEPPQT